ncbi:MAG: penicillin-binding protein 2 [Deltaproteobacteria bacterium]|nr:penicillin-binding protein 2 [Deltaproteobacteria bacterium]
MQIAPVHRDYAKRANFCTTMLSADGRRTRLYLVAACAILWSAALVARLYSLQISDFEKWQEWALKQHFAEIELASERGPIFDRNGKMMAVSVPAGSVYVRPNLVQDKKAAAVSLASILEVDPKVIAKKLAEPKPFVWVQRQIPRAKAQQVEELNTPGLGYVLESRRFYPYNQAASTLIGKVGVDGHGLSGIEETFEKQLRGAEVKARFTRDALGKMIESPTETPLTADLPKGNAIRLTIDAGLQMIVDEELAAGKENANAKSAMAALVDADTGDILAISQAPAYNYNVRNVKSKAELTNKIAETVFEPGSIMKPLVAAAAMEEKVVSPGEMINCENGRYYFAKHTIKDVHPNSLISFRDVLVRSSNIGMTKVGARLGKERLYKYLRAFGFGKDSGLGLPGESGGILRSLESWSAVDVATHSFGQGIAVTPLQMVRAMSVIANGGNLPSLRVVESDAPATSQRVVSRAVADKVKELMYAVVEDQHGTGGKAVIEGVRVGGKTGTAQKANPNGRGYMPGAYMASFVGFVDGSPIGVKKTLTLMVVIDEPNTTSIYGGALAAPVFKRIMQRSLHFLSTRQDLGESLDGALENVPETIDAGLATPPLKKGLTQISYSPDFTR